MNDIAKQNIQNTIKITGDRFESGFMRLLPAILLPD
jgi:hypothetical protein